MSAVQDRAAWTGATLDYRTDGLHTLSAAEVEEIDAALAHLREQGDLDFPDITPDSFPLPTLGPSSATSATNCASAAASCCCAASRASATPPTTWRASMSVSAPISARRCRSPGRANCSATSST